jgi:hypothetical protein
MRYVGLTSEAASTGRPNLLGCDSMQCGISDCGIDGTCDERVVAASLVNSED